MQEDFTYIDLIDKYLSGNLSPLEKERVETLLRNDAEFCKELAVFEKIYKGVSQKEEKALKQRLGTYYEEFQLENKTKKGKMRTLVFLGGAIAASFIIGATLFFSDRFNPQNSVVDPGLVDVDTTTAKKTDSLVPTQKEGELVKDNIPEKAIENNVPSEGLTNEQDEIQKDIKDSIRFPKDIDDTQLALGGFKTLPPTSVRSYTYSKFLSYTFNDTIFQLYGNPSLAKLELLSLQLIKTEELGYVLKFRNKDYTIEKTNRKLPLTPISEKNNDRRIATLFKSPLKLKRTKETIVVKTDDIVENSLVLSSLTVLFNPENKLENTYFFNEKGKNLELIIHTVLEPETAKVYRIKADRDYYYLVQGNEIYRLNKDVQEPTALKTVDIRTDKLARLFIERDPVKIILYKE